MSFRSVPKSDALCCSR